MITIREITPKKLADLFENFWEHFGGRIRDSTRDLIRDGGVSWVAIAHVDGKLAGFTCTYKDGSMLFGTTVVITSFRNLGVAKKLIEKRMQIYNDYPVYSKVGGSNLQSIRLCLHMGMQLVNVEEYNGRVVLIFRQGGNV